jgi:hypothetical protein
MLALFFGTSGIGSLIEFMANQESGYATLLSNKLSGTKTVCIQLSIQKYVWMGGFQSMPNSHR